MVTQNTLRTCLVRKIYSEDKFEFSTALDLNKCLQQIKLPILLYMGASISKLPANIITMKKTDLSLGIHIEDAN